MTASTKPTITLTIDMQHAVFESLREKRRGFRELAQELDRPDLPAQKLVTLCQKTDPVMLREDWDNVQDAIGRLTVRSKKRQPPDEARLLYPDASDEANLSRNRRAIQQRFLRARKKIGDEMAQPSPTT